MYLSYLLPNIRGSYLDLRIALWSTPPAAPLILTLILILLSLPYPHPSLSSLPLILTLLSSLSSLLSSHPYLSSLLLPLILTLLSFLSSLLSSHPYLSSLPPFLTARNWAVPALLFLRFWCWLCFSLGFPCVLHRFCPVPVAVSTPPAARS